MEFILGRKINMSQVFSKDGKSIPVTLIEAGPVFITQIKSKARDGYSAIQVGFAKSKKSKKRFSFFREFRVRDEKELENFKIGQELTLDNFEAGKRVNLVGQSKGKGFQGVVKRHGFSGGPKSHGQKDRLRAPGSIGSSFPEHVRKGTRMAGRMGGERVTVKNLEIIDIDKENNVLALKGAVPGSRGSLVMMSSLGK